MPSVRCSRRNNHQATPSVGERATVVLVDPAGGFRGFGLLTPLAARRASDFRAITYDPGVGAGRAATRCRTRSNARSRISARSSMSPAAPPSSTASRQGRSSPWGGGGRGPSPRGCWRCSSRRSPSSPPKAEDLGAEVADLVEAGGTGRRVPALQPQPVGVPRGDATPGMRDGAWWPSRGSPRRRRTLVYDTRITAGLLRRDNWRRSPRRRSSSTAPRAGRGHYERDDPGPPPRPCQTASIARSRASEHGVAPEILAPVMRDFCLADRPAAAESLIPSRAFAGQDCPSSRMSRP